MSFGPRLALALTACFGLAINPCHAASPTPQDLQKQVDELKSQIDALAQQSDEKKAEANKTHIGGYGSLDYSNLDSGNVIDLSRFVIFFGHEFTDDWRFASELEV